MLSPDILKQLNKMSDEDLQLIRDMLEKREKKPERDYSRSESRRAYTSVSPSGHHVFNDPMDTWAHDWT